MGSKIIYIHFASWDFIMEVGCSLRQWLKDNKIPYEQKGSNFYVLDANGQRTGEVYSLISDIYTVDTQKIVKQ